MASPSRKRQSGDCRENRALRIHACHGDGRVGFLSPTSRLTRRSQPQLSTIVGKGFLLGEAMYHYDAKIALEELTEEALLPHPVKLRDMILRTKLGPEDAQILNHEFQDYLTRFGELQKVGRGILEKIAVGQRKTS